ncbi:hypothetical protein A3860_17320 [Niastella vici]|uniref:Uncharacterized protein n=2 Tax=Niastella vici TaxID=1703345 RepID=A0A1V9G4E8_9BACT|nr:hypothetical protein A3860_17320 [Niastella vici]
MVNRNNYTETITGTKKSVKQYVSEFWEKRSIDEVNTDMFYKIRKKDVETWLLEEVDLLIRGPLKIKAVGGTVPTINISIREFADNLEALSSGRNEASKEMLEFCTQVIINKYGVGAIVLGDKFVTYCGFKAEEMIDEFLKKYKKKKK